MKKFDSIAAVAMPMDTINLDTDQLIPARFIRKPRDDKNYHRYLLHDQNYMMRHSPIMQFLKLYLDLDKDLADLLENNQIQV